MESIAKVLEGRPQPLSVGRSGKRPDYCPDCGGAGFYVLDVSYTDPRFSKPQPCPTCHNGELAQRLAAASQLTGWLQVASLGGYTVKPQNRDAHEAALAFVQRAAGWLAFYGGYGVGKTHLLAAIVNACNAERVGAVYYTLPDLLDMLRDAYSANEFDHRIARVLSIPVLAIDEVDKVRLTDWAREKVYQLCDARYRDRHARGTAFASNVKPDPNDPHLGYLYSRMSEGVVVCVGGGDVRPLRRER